MANYDASVRLSTEVDQTDLLKLQEKFDEISRQLDELYRKKEKLQSAGADPQGEEWQNLLEQIRPLEAEYENMQAQLEGIQGAAKNTAKPLREMKNRLLSIAMGAAAFETVKAGLLALIAAAKEGFQNLAEYSGDYNSAMSDMKSEAAQLKNALAAAFEPIASKVVPYITMFLSWMNRAVDTTARLIAVMSGKSSYTRAKTQMVDYAKSLKTASKEAKGALASFDKLNVLQKNDSKGQGSGELAGADAFETVALTDADMAMYDAVKEKVSEIIELLTKAGLLLFVMGAGGPLAGLVGKLLLIIGLVKFAISYMDAWNNGITFDNLKDMLGGLLMVIVGIGILLGPTAAAFALLAGSIAMVVLALKDMYDNGVNSQNILVLVLGLVGALIAVFVIFGSTVGVVVGAIVAVVAVLGAMVAIAGNGREAIDTLKSMCKNFADFFKKIFAGDIQGALDSLKNGFKDLANIFVILFESAVNCVIKGTNWLIDKINGIKIDLPDWIAKRTGVAAIGLHIPHIPEQKLPRLADGAVIQGGKPFAAILGDQRFGQTNIETPLSTMVEAFKQAMAESGNLGGTCTFVAQLNGKTLFSETVRQSRLHYKATGKSPFPM